MKKIAIIGGGISGLSTAYYLLKLGKASKKFDKLILIEASTKCGGWINSIRSKNNVIHETGPKSLRVSGVAGLNTLLMVDDIGITKDIIGVSRSSPAARKRLIYANNQLNILPSSFYDIFLNKPPFNDYFVKYIFKDIFSPKLNIFKDDISVYDFFSKRFAENLAKYLIDPLCRGISGGDARKLSMKSFFPLIFEAERNYGSVIKGLIFQKKAKKSEEINKSLTVNLAIGQKWQMWSTKYGLQYFIEKLKEHLIDQDNFTIYSGCKVNHISFQKDGNSILHLENCGSFQTLGVEHIFSTISSQNLASCLSSKDNELKNLLNSIESVSVAVINLEYHGNVLQRDKGFGFFIPSFENPIILGIVFDSCCFQAHDGSKNITRLTVMMGGEWFKDISKNNTIEENTFALLAIKSVEKYLGIRNPLKCIVTLNKNCIPQYYLGHHTIILKIKDQIISNKLNLDITGSSYLGIGINDCIYNARNCVENYLEINKIYN